jgi:hypothetical protein
MIRLEIYKPILDVFLKQMFPKHCNFLTKAARSDFLEEMIVAHNFVNGNEFSDSDYPEMSDPWNESATECSPMMAACLCGNLRCIKFLFKNGRSKDIFVPDSSGTTPFMRICFLTCSPNSVFSQILEYFFSGDDFEFPVIQARIRCIEFPSLKDYTPLHLMVFANNLPLAKCLCQKYGAGDDLHVFSRFDGTSPMLTAAMNGNLEMIQYFVDVCRTNFSVQRLIDFQSPRKLRWSAIHVACDRGDLEVVRLLIECGCSLTLNDYHGRTPLLVCLQSFDTSVLEKDRSCYIDIVSLLLNSGSSFNILDLRDFSRECDKHPISYAFLCDSILLIECFYPFLNLDVLRDQLCWFIDRFPGSFNVVRWIARKIFVEEKDKLKFFSMLIRECEFEFLKDIDFLDFFIFGVFDTPPRLLFDTYLKGNANVCLSRLMHVKSIHRFDQVDDSMENVFRFVELGWFHDSTSGNVIAHRVKAYGHFIFDENFDRLFLLKIPFLQSLKEVLWERESRNLTDLPKDVSSLIVHFIGCVDIKSLSFLISFLQFKELEKSLASRSTKILSLFDEFEKLNVRHASSPKSIDAMKTTSIKKRLRCYVDL